MRTEFPLIIQYVVHFPGMLRLQTYHQQKLWMLKPKYLENIKLEKTTIDKYFELGSEIAKLYRQWSYRSVKEAYS